MCRKLPRNSEEFLLVSGVGQTKARQYGPRFLALLRAEAPEPKAETAAGDAVPKPEEFSSIPEGAAVTHAVFGSGHIVSLREDRLTVRFNDGRERVFGFPACLQNGRMRLSG